MKTTADKPKIGNRLIQLIRMGGSSRQIHGGNTNITMFAVDRAGYQVLSDCQPSIMAFDRAIRPITVIGTVISAFD